MIKKTAHKLQCSTKNTCITVSLLLYVQQMSFWSSNLYNIHLSTHVLYTQTQILKK